MASFGFNRHLIYVVNSHVSRQNNHIHKIKWGARETSQKSRVVATLPMDLASIDSTHMAVYGSLYLLLQGVYHSLPAAIAPEQG